MLVDASRDMGCMMFGWPLVVPWWTHTCEVACSLIVIPYVDACVSLVFGALET
jgi:hypothetical protein